MRAAKGASVDMRSSRALSNRSGLGLRLVGLTLGSEQLLYDLRDLRPFGRTGIDNLKVTGALQCQQRFWVTLCLRGFVVANGHFHGTAVSAVPWMRAWGNPSGKSS